MLPRANRQRQTTFATILGVFLVILDQSLKRWSPIVWLHERSTPWLQVSVAVLLLVILLVRHSLPLHSPVPFFLIVAGSLSNIIDVLFRGSVVNYWPLRENTNQIFYTTNIADVIIWVGLIWLLAELIIRAIWRPRQWP
ncbi:MAG: signal peptidase II [bacterium]|nr:signal peptidase II [bacterium]